MGLDVGLIEGVRPRCECTRTEHSVCDPAWFSLAHVHGVQGLGLGTR